MLTQVEYLELVRMEREARAKLPPKEAHAAAAAAAAAAAEAAETEAAEAVGRKDFRKQPP